MQAGITYTESHNQIVGIIYRNIYSIYGFDHPKTKWKIPKKIADNNENPVGLPYPNKQTNINQSTIYRHNG